MKITIPNKLRSSVIMFAGISMLLMMGSPFVASAEVGGSITRTTDATMPVVNPVAEIELVTVGPELKECVGVGPMQCMIVDGHYFYDEIAGFEYEEGYNYELYITKTERESIPADASAYKYSLVRVKSKTAVDAHHSTADDLDQAVAEIMSKLDTVIGLYLRVREWTNGSNTFIFTEDRFSTTAGCNTIAGEYTRDGFDISFSDVVSTKKLCLADGVMAAEDALIKTVSAVDGFSITKDGVLLTGSDGSIELVR